MSEQNKHVDTSKTVDADPTLEPAQNLDAEETVENTGFPAAQRADHDVVQTPVRSLEDAHPVAGITSTSVDVDPTEDPTQGELPATVFPADDTADLPDQTPQDAGADNDGDDTA